MKLFIYLPYPDYMTWSAELFTTRVKHLKTKYEDARVITPEEGLGSVKPDDALYISGHGAAGDEKIYGVGGLLSMTAVELAHQCAGLDKAHKTIKVWVCFSADGILQGKGLAYKFWQAMHPKFPGVSVYGYRFGVVDPYDKCQEHKVAVRPQKGFKSVSGTPSLLPQLLPGSAGHWRIGIDPNGRIIPPKPLPLDD